MPDDALPIDAFLDELFALEPVAATGIGDHRHDDRWPDVSPSGRAARLAFTERWAATFAAVDPATLTPDEAADRDLLRMELDADRFEQLELQEDHWDPLTWVYHLGDGLFTLLSREFAPLADRLASVAGRLEGMPAVLADARDMLVGTDDGRPVGRFQTETALAQLPGVSELIDDALTEAERAATDDARVADLRPRLEAAATIAREALAGFEAHLRTVVLPASEGEGRLGPDLFARKMRHTMRSDALTPERILAAAEREFVAVRSEMVRLARDLWPTWRAGEDMPADDGQIVRGVLDAIAAEHPRRTTCSTSVGPRTPGSRRSAASRTSSA